LRQHPLLKPQQQQQQQQQQQEMEEMEDGTVLAATQDSLSLTATQEEKVDMEATLKDKYEEVRIDISLELCGFAFWPVPALTPLHARINSTARITPTPPTRRRKQSRHY
jgi:hypothetical protein